MASRELGTVSINFLFLVSSGPLVLLQLGIFVFEDLWPVCRLWDCSNAISQCCGF